MRQCTLEMCVCVLLCFNLLIGTLNISFMILDDCQFIINFFLIAKSLGVIFFHTSIIVTYVYQI